MKAFAIAIAASCALVGCGKVEIGPSVKGSGKLTTKSLKVGHFTKVRLDGAFDLEAKNGPQSDIQVTGDDNIVGLVKAKVDGDTLVLEVDESYSTPNTLKVAFTSPDLSGVTIDGSGAVKVQGMTGPDVAFAIDGSGEIQAEGKADSVSADINGSGKIDTTQIVSPKATAGISGSGTIKVDAEETLTVSITGSGKVLYKGKPKNVTKSITGPGEAEPL